MKRFGNVGQRHFIHVALHGGAWIETIYDIDQEIENCVALHGGAWIETCLSNGVTVTGVVALHGGAWIETVGLFGGWSMALVALHGGAWIETGITENTPKTIMLSPFTEGRGLKRLQVARNVAGDKSPFTEGRGLKPRPTKSLRRSIVALHGGAWIET